MRAKAIAAITAWTAALLVLLDAATGFAFRYPSDPRVLPNEPQAYFEYGRSSEGKLDRMLGHSDADAAPIVAAGWIDRDCDGPIEAPAEGRLGVTLHGMSFTNHIATALEAVDARIVTTTRSGPAAALNHSYACFVRIDESGGDANRVQVVGILASSVYRMLSMTGVTTAFEAPTPYTYPRYRLSSTGRLVEEQPIVRSPDGWRDPVKRQAFEAQLATSDAFFDRWLMDSGPSDSSVVVRMLRRAYAQHRLASIVRERVADANGFLDRSDLGPLMLALLEDFARRARMRGGLPIVVLIQDRPGVDALFRFLAPGLVRAGIPFVSTHDLVPTTDPANFTGDGHFIPAADRRVAERLHSVIVANIQR